MGPCGVTHRCADGGTGACSQAPRHPARHRCGACLAFFDRHEEAGPETPAPATDGPHPSFRSLAQMMSAARATSRPSGASGVGEGRFRLFGIWRAAIPTPCGLMATELILQPDLRFSQVAVLNELMTYDRGRIELGPRFIHFVVEDHQPEKYNDVVMVWVKSWTAFYTVVDADTMTFEDRIAKSSWTVKRG